MEQNNEKKKIGIKFNAFDFLIILVIAGLIAMVIWQKDIKRFTDNVQYSDIEYTFTVKGVENGKEKYLSVNALLMESGTSASMGTITLSEIKNSEREFSLVDGSVEKAEIKDQKDVKCNVKMKAVKKDNGYFSENGIMIVPGKTIRVETAKAVFDIRIESVSD